MTKHAMTEAQQLRQAVRARFYPWVEARGFVRGKATSLFTTFSRVDGSRWNVFDIQWEKYHQPCFVLNFGELPRDDASADARHIDIWQYKSIGRLQPRDCAGLGCWFHMRKPWREVLRSRRLLYSPDEVVDQLIALFPEVESWWTLKHEGPHLRFSLRDG